MKDFIKNSKAYSKYNINRYRLKNKNNKASDNKDIFGRLFYQACICAVLVVLLFAVLKIGGDNVSGLKNSLKEAVGSSMTSSQIDYFKEIVQKGINSIKNTDLPFNNDDVETKAVIRIENTYSKGSIIAENTLAEEQSISPG